jgi:hypothetical protein
MKMATPRRHSGGAFGLAAAAAGRYQKIFMANWNWRASWAEV